MAEAHYNYFRDYDPAIGRYVQSDPLGLTAGLDTFGYAAGSSPVSASDKLGLALFCGDGKRPVAIDRLGLIYRCEPDPGQQICGKCTNDFNCLLYGGNRCRPEVVPRSAKCCDNDALLKCELEIPTTCAKGIAKGWRGIANCLRKLALNECENAHCKACDCIDRSGTSR